MGSLHPPCISAFFGHQAQRSVFSPAKFTETRI
jgi:hypothetical protein